MKTLRLLTAIVLLSLAQNFPAIAADNPAPAASQAPEPPALDYFIVVTGGELLGGVIQDAHTHFITRTLTPLGLHCVGSLTVDDRAEDITNALQYALSRAPVAIVTGGLGPTDNDITRQTLSSFTAIPLQESPELIAEMERRQKLHRDQIRPNLRRQAQVPVRGTFLPSVIGTAAGLVFDLGRQVIVALPGPPRELQPMVTQQLIPWLVRRYGIRAHAASLTMRFVGAGQSLISQTMKDHVAVDPAIVQNSTFEGMRVDYTFSLPGDTPENRSRLQRLETNLLEHLGEYYYGDDGGSLEDHVLRRLRERGITLSVADAASGGALAAALGGSTNAAGVLAGAFLAAGDDALLKMISKEIGQTLPETAEERCRFLAQAAAKNTGSKWAVAISQPRREASSRNTLAVCLWRGDRQGKTLQLNAPSTDAASRLSFVTQVLDMLRRELR